VRAAGERADGGDGEYRQAHANSPARRPSNLQFPHGPILRERPLPAMHYDRLAAALRAVR
jgi:hypothetical protein